jgi:hypothetical protein
MFTCSLNWNQFWRNSNSVCHRKCWHFEKMYIDQDRTDLKIIYIEQIWHTAESQFKFLNLKFARILGLCFL